MLYGPRMVNGKKRPCRWAYRLFGWAAGQKPASGIAKTSERRAVAEQLCMHCKQRGTRHLCAELGISWIAPMKSGDAATAHAAAATMLKHQVRVTDGDNVGKSNVTVTCTGAPWLRVMFQESCALARKESKRNAGETRLRSVATTGHHAVWNRRNTAASCREAKAANTVSPARLLRLFRVSLKFPGGATRPECSHASSSHETLASVCGAGQFGIRCVSVKSGC